MRFGIRSSVLSLFVVSSVACVAPEALNASAPRVVADNSVVDDEEPLTDAGLAIVWRAGCSACSISTEAEGPDEGALYEQAHRIAVQPIEIDGDLESGFTIVFPEAPPAFVGSDTYYQYPTGMLVLSRASETVTFNRAHDVSFDYTILFDDERALASVEAVTPYYVSFADLDGRVNDEFTGRREYLDAGYYIARHDPALVRQWTANLLCANHDVTHPTLGCPPPVFAYQQAQAVDSSAELTFVPGSDDDLVDLLAGIDETAQQ